MTTNTTNSQAASTWASSERDWPEDFKLENGNYMNICTTCKQGFMGYKRRFTCKVCAEQGAPSTPREAARHNVKALTARTTELVGEVIAKGMLGVLEECIEMQLTMNELQARAIAAEDRAEKAEQYAQVALGIKDSLEGRLAEIQRGVEGLLQYIADHDWGGIPEPVPQIDALRILLQPQGQASDTSGLPDDQIIQRAGEIFGFKPHKQDEVNKQKFLDFARWVKEEV